MGSWDCYCAICAGPMTRVPIPNRNPPADSARSTEAGGEAVQEPHKDDTCYDLKPEEVEWLKDCRVLGYDIDAGKAYISGRAKYSDYGHMYLLSDGHVPEILCYGTDETEEHEATIPFHWDCYQILILALTGSDDQSLINKEALWKAMMSVSEEYGVRLDISYDEPGHLIEIESLGEQFWMTHYGHEVFVTSPLPREELREDTRRALEQLARMPPLDSSLGDRVRSDFFGGVPRIVQDIILDHLDHKSLMNLLLASWRVHSSTHGDNGFWKMRIKKHLPWFFEVDHVFQAEDAPDGGMKGLYLWAQSVVPKMHTEEALRGIVNRRRIWYVCNQITELYDKVLEEVPPADVVES